MTLDERIDLVRIGLDNDGETSVSDDVIVTHLRFAKDAILNRMYPQTNYPENADVPVRWQTTQCKLAIRYIARIGIEGETKHSENGIDREYATVDDLDLLGQILPYVRVL